MEGDLCPHTSQKIYSSSIIGNNISDRETPVESSFELEYGIESILKDIHHGTKLADMRL